MIIINIGREVLIPTEICVIEIIIIFMKAGKKNDNKIISKPMFYNSELENNGNPECNITTFM